MAILESFAMGTKSQQVLFFFTGNIRKHPVYFLLLTVNGPMIDAQRQRPNQRLPSKLVDRSEIRPMENEQLYQEACFQPLIENLQYK